jgi:hypothetical protein
MAERDQAQSQGQAQGQGQGPSLSQVQGEGAGGFVPGSGFVNGAGPTVPPDDGARSDGHGGNPDSPFGPGEGGEGEVESWHQGQAPKP